MNRIFTLPRKATLLSLLLAVACSAVAAAGPGCPPVIQAAPPVFDRQPWLDDLQEARLAFSTRYAGLEWEVFGRDHAAAGIDFCVKHRIVPADANASRPAARVYSTSNTL